MTEPLVLRPNPRVFVFRSTFRVGLFTIPLVLLPTALAPLVQLSSGLVFTGAGALWLLLVAFWFVQRKVIFGKTRYLLHTDRVVYQTGGLLSERSVDLQYRNVTKVSLRLPYLEHWLFSTGHVTVQAAGSSAAEVYLESIDEPQVTYGRFEEALRKNGFSLARRRRVQEEKPGIVGALYVLISSLGSTGVALFFILPSLSDLAATFAAGGELRALWEEVSTDAAVTPSLDLGAILAGLGVALFVVLLLLGLLVIKTLDILRRTYTLHDDVIDYRDGFLTKHQAFIPMENLADVEVVESLVQRVLAISTLKVSCQGAGANIQLAALPNGKRFKANLERLIESEKAQEEERRAAQAPEASEEAEGSEGEASETVPLRRAPALPSVEGLPRIEGRYDWIRGILGSVVGAVFLFLATLGGGLIVFATIPDTGWGVIPASLTAGLVVAATTMGPIAFRVLLQAFGLRYAVDQRKVTHTYEVVNRKQLEFTVDKISAVVIQQTPIDRLFHTARVSFTSIGSAEKIVFENLKNADAVVDAVLTRMGLDPEAVERTIEPDYTLGSMLRSADPPFVLGGLAVLTGGVLASLLPQPSTGLGIAFAGGFVCAGRLIFLDYYYRHARLETGERWMRVVQGLWTREVFYIPDHQVRGLETRCNLGESRGQLAIHSGGGAIARLAHLPAVTVLQDRLDERLHRGDTGQALGRELVDERKPVLGAVLLTLWLVLPLLLPILPYLIAAVRRVRYRLEISRTARESGVFFRSCYTILLGRIDHLTTARGVVNRLTGTGSMGIRTLGSQGTDLQVGPIREHQAFYERIEGMTRRHLGDPGDES